MTRGTSTTGSSWALKAPSRRLSSISSGPGCAAGRYPRPAAARSSCRCPSACSTTPSARSEHNTSPLAPPAAAHGRARTSGPAGEGSALRPAPLVCGRCGGRMPARYPPRGSRQLPTYTCQRDGIENARPICAAIPGHTLDEHVGQLLIDTLTPLAVEAALQVSAELQQRAADADALRAAHVERARYHADLARRRYLTVDPANRLVAGTLEAGWNTALRPPTPPQAPSHHAPTQHPQ